MKTFFLAVIFCLLASSGWAATPTQTVTFRLSWTDNSGNNPAISDQEDNFNIYRCAGVGCTAFVKVGSVGPNITTYTDTISGDTGGIAYRYQITAQNKAGESAPSNIVAGASPFIFVIPGAPGGLIATLQGVSVP